MASIISLKRRIKAAQNVSKTTRAMQMIAASKFKKAQDAALAARPYVEKLHTLNQTVSSRIENTSKYPYLVSKNITGKSLLLVLSPDKGLCGGLIANLLKEFLTYNKTNADSSYIVMGKKMEARVTSFTKEVIATFQFGTVTPTFDLVYPLIKLINDHYLKGEVDSVKVLYTDFSSIFTQTPRIVSLLPLSVETVVDKEKAEKLNTQPYLVEPRPEEILPDLLSHTIEMSLYQYLLESFASEQAARMISMQNATDNANDIIDSLKLEYNKTRQAKITSEILDITGASVSIEE